MNKLPRRIRFSLEAAALAVSAPSGRFTGRHGCGVIKPDSTDAVAAAPDHHKVILENDAVRVLEATSPVTQPRTASHASLAQRIFRTDLRAQ